MSTQEPMVIAGLTFTPVPLADWKTFCKAYSANNGLSGPRGRGRIICLIQDRATGRYETKTSLYLHTTLALVASGKCSTLLQRKYPGRVVPNILVWVAMADKVTFDTDVMMELFGQWINTKKETIRAKYWADRLITLTADEIRAFKKKFPQVYKRTGEFRDLEQYLSKR